MTIYIYFLLIVLLCLNNVLIIYKITSIVEPFRLPIQILLILLAINAILTNRSINNKKNTSLNILIGIFVVYIIFQIIFNSSNYFNDFSNSIFGLTTFILFLNCKYNDRSLQLIKKSVFPILLIISVLYLYSRVNPPSPSDDIWPLYANSIYYPVCFLPWAFLNKGKSILSMIVVFICTLLSLKQGAFIAIAVSMLIYTVMNARSSGRKVMRKIILVFCTLIVLGSILYSYVVNTFDADILEGFSTISEDGGSGRADIYSAVIKKLSESDFIQLLFGHGGLNSVVDDIGISAHNDFLEVIYDFGFVGFILYLSIIICIVRKTIYSIRTKRNDSLMLFISLIIFLILTMVSHIFFILKYSLFIFAMWGFCLNLKNKVPYDQNKSRINCPQ